MSSKTNKPNKQSSHHGGLFCPVALVCLAYCLGCGASEPQASEEKHDPKAAKQSPADIDVQFVSSELVSSERTPLGESKETPSSKPAGAAHPRLVVGDSIHNFGVMSPREVRSHVFRFRNEGQAPLNLTGTSTNCKCVSHTLSQTVLLPGEEGTLRLTWRGGDIEKDRLTARIRIETNDPEKDVVEFSAFGRVAAEISLSPTELRAQEVAPGEPLDFRAMLGSRKWTQVEIEEVRSPSDAIHVDYTPLTQDESEQYGNGWRLTVRADPSATFEPFRDQVEVVISGKAEADGEKLERMLRIPVSWELRQAVTLSGPGVDEQGDIHLGRLGREPLRKRYLLKVNDDQPELALLNTEITPGFLKAQLQPYRVTSKSSLYRLEITGPKASLASVGAAEGTLRLEFDHPRIKRFEAAIEIGESL